METQPPLRKVFQAVCWPRGPISGPLTSQTLSALLKKAAAAQEETDFRCEIRCDDGFSLRLLGVGDEGFESDEEAAGVADDRLQEEIRVSDHALRAKQLPEEDSSSANSSCSDNDEPAEPAPPPPQPAATGAHTIHGSDILFCHTDPAVPRGVVFVVRQPCAAKMDSALEAIVLRCSRETVATDLYATYHEVTRRLKWERYTNAKRKSDVSRASFRHANDSLRLRPGGRPEAPPPPPPPPLPAEREQPRSLIETACRLGGGGADSGPLSLPETSEISRIISLSTPEDGWAVPDGRRRDRPACHTPTRYSHNKGPAPPVPAPAPAPRKHPTNPNLMLVPTKNGLEPYRVITGGEAPRPPLLLYAAEFAPHAPRPDWAQKMSQFDANNNRSRPAARQQLFWLTSAEPAGRSGGRRPEPRPRARSKSPAGRQRGFELPGSLSQALRGLTSHLKRPPAEAVAAPPPTHANPKSVMKRRDKVAGSPETKRVTFSAYSTVQVMD